jgi:1-acylglycerone phosphate reductase
VIEVVTGFVKSNILHHGLHAPETSLYLSIQSTVEDIKYRGNSNGMSPEVYDESVVAKLMRPRVSPEIWEGALARSLRLLATLLPLHLLVSHSVIEGIITSNKN